MAIEHARAHTIPKPWGVLGLLPWSKAHVDGNAIGEIWYERSGQAAADTSLLLKLLFTSERLSIQVHPDDKIARSIGLLRGKSEAWYVLTATPGAKVALGLNHNLTRQQLHHAIDDGSISNLVVWQTVSPNDVIFVPAGTIHAIGAGLVIAEIQQRSDATFRLFDYGRQRQLHADSAVAVANTGPAVFQVQPKQLTHERTLLVSNPHFVFERINLAPNTASCLAAERETWLLIISGGACIGSFDVGIGDVVFAQSDRVVINTKKAGMVGLVAYTGGSPISHFLQDVEKSGAMNPVRSKEVQVPTSLPQLKAASANGRPVIPQ
jgi:mannose-6-phosphate isomerase